MNWIPAVVIKDFLCFDYFMVAKYGEGREFKILKDTVIYVDGDRGSDTFFWWRMDLQGPVCRSGISRFIEIL